jgi:hypothetical protein
LYPRTPATVTIRHNTTASHTTAFILPTHFDGMQNLSDKPNPL